MTDPVAYPELETDKAAIAAFQARENARTEAAICDDRFEADVALAKDILERDDHLSGLIRRGRWIYNFLRNAERPKGLWRRLPEAEPATVDAAWQPVFDLDQFCKDSGEDWHWRGAATAFFDPDRVLILLSWQGSDQTRMIEWDLDAQAPVPGGFDLGPERSNVHWVDPDTLLYATASGEGAATRSGWPGRLVRLKRGMDPTEAPVVFEVDHEDLLGVAMAFRAVDGSVAEATIRVRVIGDTDVTLYPEGIGGRGIPLDAPRNTTPAFSSTHYAYVAADDGPDPAGTFVLKKVGSDEKRILFTPRPYTSVDSGRIHIGHRWMLWIETERMQPRVMVLDLQDDAAQPVELPLPCDAQAVYVFPFDAEPQEDGPMQMMTTGFLTPTTTWLFDLDKGPEGVRYEVLTEEPPTFDATGMSVHLHSAISDDGTEVPYHIVLPKDRDGPMPVMQYAYGGFGVSMAPHYGMLHGPLWLERGGAYVLAYIRGGGEFGTDWHMAAKGHKRHKAFEDFAAVATDLVERGYSVPDKIGCHGGSNGGLLVSVMLTRYPERFGAVWASVAVADMLRFHLFPAGAGWIDEYGDPDDPKDRAALLGYSPMHQVATVADRPYPQALISTNDSDDRVDPSHSRRLAAALIDAGQPAFYHSRAGGHGGGGATSEMARDRALGYAFLRHALKAR